MDLSFVPDDHGPTYVETVGGRFPVEPWNTASNLAFLVVIVYLAVRLRGRMRRHPVLAAALPLLFVGWVGGTLYHATRSHIAWFLLDYLSIFVLALLGMYYFWLQLLGKRVWAMTTILAVLLACQAIQKRLPIPEAAAVSAAYSVLALALLAPAVLHCARRMPRHWPELALALACFAVAVTFRQLDNTLGRRWFPGVGTHFLWHIFGALATFLLVRYLFASEERDAQAATAAPPRGPGANVGLPAQTP